MLPFEILISCYPCNLNHKGLRRSFLDFVAALANFFFFETPMLKAGRKGTRKKRLYNECNNFHYIMLLASRFHRILLLRDVTFMKRPFDEAWSPWWVNLNRLHCFHGLEVVRNRTHGSGVTNSLCLTCWIYVSTMWIVFNSHCIYSLVHVHFKPLDVVYSIKSRRSLLVAGHAGNDRKWRIKKQRKNEGREERSTPHEYENVTKAKSTWNHGS